MKIAVAMSGGVDSSVCADILVRQGHEVMGFTAVMSGSIAEKKNGPAKEVCDYLGIPFHVVDVRREFEQAVIVYFESEYLSGRTPSPCVLCNSIIKFGLLWNRMSELGAERISTGHYVRISKDNDGNVFLLRGIDTVKDQSYFLHRLNREQLTRAIFPLGSMLKKEVYEYARSKNIPFGGGKESQELCFVEEGKTGEWIESRNPDASVSGDIVSVHGGVMGQHRGIHCYTVGQRKGVGVAGGKPLYVVRVERGSNRVVLGEREDVMTNKMFVQSVNWLEDYSVGEKIALLTQIRYNHAAGKSIVRKTDSESAEVEFAEPQFAITPGQAAVFYDGEQVVGGGWIS